MLKLGTKCIKNLKLGDKSIFKVMCGSKTVYRNYPIFLDYIGSTGTQWIDLGLTASSVKRFVIKGTCFNNETKNTQLLGTSKLPVTTFFGSRFLSATGGHYWGCNDINGQSVGDCRSLSIIDATIESPSSQFGTVKDLATNTTKDFVRFTSNNWAFDDDNLQLFGGYVPDRLSPNATCYSLQLYTANGLVRDLRPCIDPCGVVCMYDMVTGKYFYNQGIGTFKAGGRFVESIIFDGNSWIDTGKYANQNIEINTTFKHNMVERAIYGVRDGNNNCTGYASVSGAWRFGSNVANYRTEVNTIYNVVQNRQGIDINSQYTAYTDTTSEFTSSYTILLGKQNNTTFNPFKGEINVFRIKENGVAIQDLRPLVDENGVACFVDLVTGERFYNQGTGKLKYKDFERIPYLEFNGTNYIDTGYKPNSNSSVSVSYYPYNSTAFTCIFGTQDTTNTNRFYAVISLTSYRLQLQSANTSGFWGVSSTGLVNSANGTFTSTQQKVGLTIDNYSKQIRIKSDELTKTFDMATYNSSLGTVDCQYNLLLGNRSTTGVPSTSNAFKGKIHDFQVKESGELIRDYIPVKRSDGVKCMYDRVEGKYYELIGV